MPLYNTTEAAMRAKLAGWVSLYAVAIIFIILRLYSRIHIFGALTVDDWLMVGAGIAYTGSMITEVFIWKAFIDFAIVTYIKAAFASFFTIVLAMWLIKFSVWCFMKRLMHGKWMNRAANAVFVVLVLSYIALNVFDLAWCSPINHIWEFKPDGCIFRLKTIVIYDGVINAFSDILLMILPLPLIWRVRLPLSTKLNLTAIFALGFVVIAAVIMSSYMGSQEDFIKGANFTIWTNVSLTAATAVACAPQIRTLFLKSTRKNRSGEVAATSFDITDQDQVKAMRSNESFEQASQPEADEKQISDRKKSIPLTLSSKYLRGGGKVGVGNGHATIESISETESV